MIPCDATTIQDILGAVMFVAVLTALVLAVRATGGGSDWWDPIAIGGEYWW